MTDSNENRTLTQMGVNAGLAVIGGCIWFMFSVGAFDSFFDVCTWIYQKVGVTVIALGPLAVWSIYAASKYDENSRWTLSYIGTTAQRVGLLGTVAGIVAATLRIGENLNAGAAGAVSGALPMVGQALVSTAVGFVIALICDFFIFLQGRNGGVSGTPADKSAATQ